MPPQDDPARDPVRLHVEPWVAESPFVGEDAAEEQQAPIHPWYQEYTPFREDQGLEGAYGREIEETDEYVGELDEEQAVEEVAKEALAEFFTNKEVGEQESHLAWYQQFESPFLEPETREYDQSLDELYDEGFYGEVEGGALGGFLTDTEEQQLETEPSSDLLDEPGRELEILGKDTRVLAEDTLAVPYRWICALDIKFRDPDQRYEWSLRRGTGILIGTRHVLTAAHNLDPWGRGPAKEIEVVPARNGRDEPLGSTTTGKWRTSKNWKNKWNTYFDYGLITLEEHISFRKHPAFGTRPRGLGTFPLGFWGSERTGQGTSLEPLEPEVLKGKMVNVTGYPGDRCGTKPFDPKKDSCSPRDQASIQWTGQGKLERVNPPAGRLMGKLIEHTVDTAKGQSGSPVWLLHENHLHLVGIHATPSDVRRSGKRQPPATNIAVRIREELLSEVRSWIEEDEKKEEREVTEFLDELDEEEFDEDRSTELEDEEPNEEAYEPMDETSELYPEQFTGKDEYPVAQPAGTERLPQEHFESLVEEAKALLDEMASGLRRHDFAAMNDVEIEAFLNRYQPVETQLPRGFRYLLDDVRDTAKRLFKGAMNLSELQTHQARFQPMHEGQVGPTRPAIDVATRPAIDVDRAVRENQRYGKQLGWRAHYDRFTRLLRFTNPIDRSDRELAKAIADWQRSQKGLTVDGTIGPETWLRMLTAMKAAKIWPRCVEPQVAREDPSALNVSPVGNLDYSGTPVTSRMAILEGESLPVAGTVFYPAERAGQGTPFNTRLVREGPVPIVFMAHGMSALFRDSTNPFEVRLYANEPGVIWTPIHSHKGYEYFQRLLAQMGIIAVSVDFREINRRFPRGGSDVISLRANLILESIRHFQSLRSGSAPIHKDLISFSKVGLMGHSQGGEAAVVVPENLARRRTDITGVSIKGVFALAPTDSGASSGQPKGFSFMTMLPAGDGDEYRNSGAKFYDRAISDPFKCQLYVHEANHSLFNAEWSDEWDLHQYLRQKENDKRARSRRPPEGPAVIRPRRMLRSDHERILSAYGCAFFRRVLLDDASLVKFLKGQELPPGVPIPFTHISFESKEGSLTVDDHENRDININTLRQRTKQSGGLTAKEHEFAEQSTSTFFGATLGMKAQSSSPTGQFRSPLVGNTDLTGREIWIRAAEVYNGASIPAGATGFKLGLEDSSGTIAFVDSDDVGALPRPFDRKAPDSTNLVIEMSEVRKNFTKTMLKTLRFPVSCFKDSYPGLDIKKVRAIVLRLDRGDGRELAFDQLQIVKP